MTIEVFSKSSCPMCVLTKDFLKRENIDFVEYDVEIDNTARNLIQALGYQSVPVVLTDSQGWSGYRPDLLRKYRND